MKIYPISIASVFRRKDEPDPFCSICFFAQSSQCYGNFEIQDYIKSTIFPRLAAIVVNSPEEIVQAEIEKAAANVREAFQVECKGYLNDYCLSVDKEGL